VQGALNVCTQNFFKQSRIVQLGTLVHEFMHSLVGSRAGLGPSMAELQMRALEC
jgi:hypothetical protein